MAEKRELNIAEIPFDDGGIQYRYSRYLSPDGNKWIRHGLFRAIYRNGRLASEGSYLHGVENGVWTDYHDNGERAAEGSYEDGRETGTWKFWDIHGNLESVEEY